MNNIIQTIQHTARAAAVLLIALLTAQTAWAWSGQGTEADPYIISTPEDLLLLAYRVNGTHGETLQDDGYEGKYFKLGGDIAYEYNTAWDDATSEETNYEAIGSDHPFKGHFDGQGHTVSGIRIYKSGDQRTDKYQGLFGSIVGSIVGESAEVKNVVLADARITGYNHTGGIVGESYSGSVSNCHVLSNVTIHAVQNQATCHGGIVGSSYSLIEGCTSAARITTTGTNNNNKFGGIVGGNFYLQSSTTAINHCLYIGDTVEGAWDVGAIAGFNGGEITNSYFCSDTFTGWDHDVKELTNANSAVGYNDTSSHTGYGTTTNVGRAYSATAGTGVILGIAGNPNQQYTPNGLKIYTVGYAYNGSFYCIDANSNVTLTVSHAERPGYMFGGYQSSGVTLNNDGTFTMPAKTVTVTATWYDLALFGYNDDPLVDGSADHPYVISNADGWDLFCDALQDNTTWNRFSGKIVKLDANISVTRMAGSDSHDFCGTFDGRGHTITLNGNIDNGCYTLFRNVSTAKANPDDAEDTPAAIRNLHVTGTITTANKYAAGLISGKWGNVTIENCRSSVIINSSVSGDGTHAGLVAVNNNFTLDIIGCVFDGKLLTTNGTANCGGFVGWNDGTLNISNSIYAPAALADGETEVQAGDGDFPSATFARNGATITNCYYTRTLGDAQGKQARSISKGAYITDFNISGTATQYTVSGITAYATGIKYGGVLYAGSGDNVSLTLANNAAPEGYQYGYAASAGTLSGNANDGYTLTMPDENVTVSVNTAVLTAIPWSGDGSKDYPYIIKYASQLDLLAYRVNGTHGETRQTDGYEGVYFKLNNDISYPHTSAWNDFTSDESTESNYEAIGGYYGGNRSFCGHFNGNNKAISGIRIYKNGDDYADLYQGIFGYTGDGAVIHDLTLADARITGFGNTGGIVGYNEGGTVTRCHVAGDVAVCAVQSDAWFHGGIVGYNNTGTIEQCTSAATLTTADADNSMYYGGIAGYNENSTLCDNLAIGATVPAAKDNTYGAITGANYGTLQRNYYTACNVANVENATGVGCGYISDGNGGYTTADVTTDNGAVSIHTLTLAEGITTSTPVTTTIGITGYYAQGTAIALSYSGTPGNIPDGYQYSGFTASAGTISGSTLTMPAADVTVSLALTVLPWSGDGSKDYPYIIEYASQLDLLAYRVNGTHGETCQTDGYEGVYFKLNNDISYLHNSDWNAFTSTESNYEAIGCRYNGDNRYFSGHFDGNSKTISGIRIYKDGTGYADYYQGLFGRTNESAVIHDLTLADARITGFDRTGGIVGYNTGGTVTRCHVAGDVAVCAVQSYAFYHGGIVGYNNTGTIEQCTSAATLTTASATNSWYYGGIAGYNENGTLCDNLAIGATVPAAKDNTYGAITGQNGGTLQRNYYAACKVANTPNATGVGCNNADVNNDNNPDGAVCINTLALTARVAPDGNFWTTYYNSALGFTIDADENACAYTATYSAGQLTLHKLGKEIPKGMAVIIVADNGVVSMTAATDLDDFSDTNDLRGVDVDTPVANIRSSLGDGNLYVLGMTTVNTDNGPEKHFGFHRYSGTDMAAHKAFVHVASSPSQSARSLTMVFDDATAIEGLTPAAAPQSQAADHWFTLDGRRLQAKPTAPGIYVNNGHKIVIK